MAKPDEFVDKMQKEIELSQQLFADYALHGRGIPRTSCKSSSYNGESPDQPPKPTRLVVSKFRKGRKRRNRGYYSSSLAQKQIKFTGALPEDKVQQSQDNATAVKVSVSSSNLQSPCLHVLSLPDLVTKHNDGNQCVKFASAVWQLLPSQESDIVEVAIIIDKDHKLTWLDLHTLNPVPSPFVFNAIVSHCGNSGKGWLSKYVVDAYLSLLVQKANLKKTEYFGSLDCDQSLMIIKKNSIKNKFIFASKILESKCTELRAIIYLPVLLNKHFVLFWFCKETNCLTLIDSNTKCESKIAVSSLHTLAEFLKSFVGGNKQIAMKQSTFIEQPDSNSCGVCVCIAANMINKSVLCENSANKITGPHVNDFRYTIMHDLYAYATQCDPLINEVGKAVFGDSAVLTLPNIGNTCWFNSTIQAIVAVSKKISFAKSKSNEPLLENDLKSFVIGMISGKIDNETALKKAILFVCETCTFRFGDQQDPEEFYSQSNLTSILKSIGIACALEWQTAYRCKNCNAISYDQLLENTNLLLPIGSQSSDCRSLRDFLNAFLDGMIDSKICNDCANTGIHTSKVVFQQLPSCLVICLSRIIHADVIRKSVKAISPNFALTLNNAQHCTSVSYELTSVLVHLGASHESGHYVCYNFISKDCVQVLDDSQSYFQSYDEAKNIIETNSYLFFYAKTGISNLPSDFSSDSDNSDARQLLLPKRFVKRRRPLNVVSLSNTSSAELKVSYKIRLAEFKPQYLCSDKFGTNWESLNQEKLTFIISNLVEVICTSLLNAQVEQRYYRHNLYLNSCIRNLKKYNDEFDLPSSISEKFALDLGSYVRKVLCQLVFNDRIVGNGSATDFISQQITVGNLQFKNFYVNSKSDIANNLALESENCCNEYLRLVSDYEALIYYSMSEYKLDYDTASMLFKPNQRQLQDHTYSQRWARS